MAVAVAYGVETQLGRKGLPRFDETRRGEIKKKETLNENRSSP